METKKCCSCKVEKDISEFNKNKSKSDGLGTECRECIKLYKKNYYINNKDFVLKKNNENYYSNKEYYLRQMMYYRLFNPEKMQEKSKIYYQKNKHVIAYKHSKNRAAINYSRNIYERKRLSSDNLYYCKERIRKLITVSFKDGFSKKARSSSILACSFEFFKKYIELQFTEEMSWVDRGNWHLDHIIPISSANTAEEIIRLNHWSNFQPLWAKDNLAKSNTMPPQETIDMVNMIYECSKCVP